MAAKKTAAEQGLQQKMKVLALLQNLLYCVIIYIC